jgi:Lon protease-like protein
MDGNCDHLGSSSAVDASAHSYLGTFEYQQNDRHFFTTGELIEIPLILFNKIVLFPGDSLPLRIQKTSPGAGMYEFLRDRLASQALKAIGVVTQWPRGTAVDGVDFELFQPVGSHMRAPSAAVGPSIPSVGVVVEVVSWSAEAEGELVIMGKARQRFRLAEMSARQGVVLGQARVLDDEEPPPPPLLRDAALTGARGTAEPALGATLTPFPLWVSGEVLVLFPVLCP